MRPDGDDTAGGRRSVAQADQFGTTLRSQDPRQIGPYQVLRRLGSGGMGTVYLAHRVGSARRVALKVINPDLVQDEPKFRERFAREIAAVLRVEGPCTARVLDSDPAAAVPWMATEFIPGDTLAVRVRDRGPLPIAEVVQLAAGLAEALAAIHRVGLIHRDLKPSNVILAVDGPRVIDFGIAREVDATHLTQRGEPLGTVSYMSPEQAAAEEVTAATDVFSLGGMIHHAATGEPPFGPGHPAVVMHRIMTAAPDLSRIRHPELRQLVADCLRKDPAARPTPDDVLRACLWLAGLPLRGEDEPVRERAPVLEPESVPEPERPAPGRQPIASHPDLAMIPAAEPRLSTPEGPGPVPQGSGRRDRRRSAGGGRRRPLLRVGIVLSVGALAFVVQHDLVAGGDTPREAAPVAGVGTHRGDAVPDAASIPAPGPSAPTPVAAGAVGGTVQALAGAQVAACEKQHHLTQAHQQGRILTTETGRTTSFLTCSWPPPPGADADGFSLIKLSDVQGPGADEASGTTRADRISGPCRAVVLSYEYGSQGGGEHVPPFRVTPGTVTDLATPGRKWAGDPANLSFYPLRDEVVVLHNDKNLLTDARCAP